MLTRTREIAVILLGVGADPMCVSSDGLDAASGAARKGDAKLLEAILGCNSFRAPIQTPISRGISGGAPAPRMKNVDIFSASYTTPLHEAAAGGSLQCVRLLLSDRQRSSIDLDMLDRPSFSTPLMLACMAGHTQIVEMLIERGSNLDAEDRRAITALVLAAQYGHVSCVRTIIALKPYVIGHKNSLKETVLEMLARILKQDVSSTTCPLISGLIEMTPTPTHTPSLAG
jgi:hypothetical protein